MTWTYVPDLRLTVPLHEVRFLIGDINVKSQQLSDEDITYILTRNANNVRKSAWKAAEQMVAIYAQRANVSVGPIQVLNNQRFSQWKELAEILKREYLHPGGGKLTDIADGALVNRSTLGGTRLGGGWSGCPTGDWHDLLQRTGTAGGGDNPE